MAAPLRRALAPLALLALALMLSVVAALHHVDSVDSVLKLALPQEVG